MKKIKILKVELKNFKNHSSLSVDLSPTGIVASGFNGSGKSSILQGIMWVLGMTIPAEQILNSSTLAPASVEMVLSVDGEDIKLSRTLIPQKNEAGKVVASTSNYAINGQPEKASLFASKVAEIFGTKDWQTLLNPSLVPFLKDARTILLQVCNAPSERDFLSESNPALADIIGATSFSDFEAREKATIQALGKKIDAIPAKIEELSAMLQEIPEVVDEAPIHARIAEIREILKGVDTKNAERADQYNKVACEAQNLRSEAQKLRNLAAQKVAEANKEANKQADEADALIAEWNRTLAGLRRAYDRIKEDINQTRNDLATHERRAAEIYNNMESLAAKHQETSLKPIDSEKLGHCTTCGKWCHDLAEKGVGAAEKQRSDECARIIQAGKEARALRDIHLNRVKDLEVKINSLTGQEHEIEAKINGLGEAPTAPERKVIESTEESHHLEQQAADLEATASSLIQSNKSEIMPKNQALISELQQLNEKLTRGAAATQTRKNNDKINARIEELREEEKQLRLTQLSHQQHIAQLKEFYKKYADSVTASVNKLFEGTDYEIRLFETNMGNDKGVATMQPMKDGSTNLSTAEALIFNLRFVERVLMKHYRVQCPVLVDNAECVSLWGLKLIGKHQSIIAVVTESPLAIHKIDGPKETQSQSK